jgi:hypothetical protein
MGDHRRSYLKTTVAAAVAFVGGVTVAGIVVWWPTDSLPLRALQVVIVLLVAPFAGWMLLVASGGVIALRRDMLESRGLPYALHAPRERRAGPIVRAMWAVSRAIRAPFLAPGRLDLRPGEIVQVRSFEEIRRTLDDHGMLNGLLFMPEMLAACGRQFRVFRRVDKLHDWLGHTGLRRVHNTVLLEGQRCDGGGHDGCQSGCYMRWNEAWLRRMPRGTTDSPPVATPSSGTARNDLVQLARRRADDGSELMVCQTTQLAAGTSKLSFADPRHYLRDLLTGNSTVGPLFTGAALAAFNGVQRRRRGTAFPNLELPDRKTSPHESLELRPGELVRVRSKREIEATLTSGSRNRGLWFDVEMLRFCGAEFRVAERVDRLLDERAGRMRVVTTPCIRLDGVAASGEYLGFCAQNELIFWREIWLTRPSRG